MDNLVVDRGSWLYKAIVHVSEYNRVYSPPEDICSFVSLFATYAIKKLIHFLIVVSLLGVSILAAFTFDTGATSSAAEFIASIIRGIIVVTPMALLIFAYHQRILKFLNDYKIYRPRFNFEIRYAFHENKKNNENDLFDNIINDAPNDKIKEVLFDNHHMVKHCFKDEFAIARRMDAINLVYGKTHEELVKQFGNRYPLFLNILFYKISHFFIKKKKKGELVDTSKIDYELLFEACNSYDSGIYRGAKNEKMKSFFKEQISKIFTRLEETTKFVLAMIESVSNKACVRIGYVGDKK